MSLPVRATVLVAGDSADILIHNIQLLLSLVVLEVILVLRVVLALEDKVTGDSADILIIDKILLVSVLVLRVVLVLVEHDVVDLFVKYLVQILTNQKK